MQFVVHMTFSMWPIWSKLWPQRPLNCLPDLVGEPIVVAVRFLVIRDGELVVRGHVQNAAAEVGGGAVLVPLPPELVLVVPGHGLDHVAVTAHQIATKEQERKEGKYGKP